MKGYLADVGARSNRSYFRQRFRLTALPQHERPLPGSHLLASGVRFGPLATSLMPCFARAAGSAARIRATLFSQFGPATLARESRSYSDVLRSTAARVVMMSVLLIVTAMVVLI